MTRLILLEQIRAGDAESGQGGARGTDPGGGGGDDGGGRTAPPAPRRNPLVDPEEESTSGGEVTPDGPHPEKKEKKERG